MTAPMPVAAGGAVHRPLQARPVAAGTTPSTPSPSLPPAPPSAAAPVALVSGPAGGSPSVKQPLPQQARLHQLQQASQRHARQTPLLPPQAVAGWPGAVSGSWATTAAAASQSAQGRAARGAGAGAPTVTAPPIAPPPVALGLQRSFAAQLFTPRMQVWVRLGPCERARMREPSSAAHACGGARMWQPLLLVGGARGALHVGAHACGSLFG